MSINTDVSLWLDYRSYCKATSLKVVDNFVIVTNTIHDEFDTFRKTELQKFNDLSLLPAIELLKFWQIFCGTAPSLVSEYGQDYVALSKSQVDELCTWVDEMRIKFMSKGQAIFEEHIITQMTDTRQNYDKEQDGKVIVIIAKCVLFILVTVYY